MYFSVQYSYYSYSLSFKSIWWKWLSFERHWALHYSWHQLEIYTIIKSLPDESYSIPLVVRISKSVHMCLSSQQLSRWASAITVTRKKNNNPVSWLHSLKLKWPETEKTVCFFATKNEQNKYRDTERTCGYLSSPRSSSTQATIFPSQPGMIAPSRNTWTQ